MSYARGYGLNGKSIYANVAKPMDCNLQFTVTPTNGLGVTSVKSNGFIRNVFMHTSTTPSSNDGYLNPNPANGYALVQFKNNFNCFLNMSASFLAPSTGSVKVDNSALTIGVVYIISTLGDASLATWRGVGVPAGITPAVGVAFVATSVGAGANTSTSRVSTSSSSGIVMAEVVGLPNSSINSANIASNGGAWILLQFSSATASVAAPATGSICCVKFSYDGSTVTVDGL